LPYEEKTVGAHGKRSVCIFVHSYLMVRFDLPSSVNFRDINGVQKLGSRTLIRGHLGTVGFYGYDFLILIFND